MPDIPRVCESLGIPWLSDLSGYRAWDVFVRKVPIGFARSHSLLGVVDASGKPVLIAAGYESFAALDGVFRLLRTPCDIAMGDAEVIRAALNAAYEQVTNQTTQALASLDGRPLDLDLQAIPPREDLLDSGDREPVVRLVNSMLFEAVAMRASDVHVQPYKETVGRPLPH